MYSDTSDHFATVGAQKVETLHANPIAFLIGAAMAGAYIGFGDIIMFSVGAHVDAAYVHLVMGAAFAAALTFVIFAGSELFTGMTMYMPFALFGGKARLRGVLGVWIACWLGNLVGSIVLALLVKMAGGGILLTDGSAAFMKAVEAKMAAPSADLFARGLLCNWLVCLAIWMAGRTTNDGAKLGLIFWPVFVFVASGFEHSVANMFDFALALIAPHPAGISLAGAVHNELWVTLGNLVGGAVFMAFGYWLQGDVLGRLSPSKIGAAATTPPVHG